jgi:hypothetical protein
VGVRLRVVLQVRALRRELQLAAHLENGGSFKCEVRISIEDWSFSLITGYNVRDNARTKTRF